MRIPVQRVLSTLTILALGLGLPGLGFAAASEHIVSNGQLNQAVAAQVQTRQQNLAKVKKFFSSPRAEQALKSAHLDPVQVRKAVPTLNDQELARLAQETDKAQKNFAAGDLTNQQITYILIALATAVIVLIAVH